MPIKFLLLTRFNSSIDLIYSTAYSFSSVPLTFTNEHGSMCIIDYFATDGGEKLQRLTNNRPLHCLVISGSFTCCGALSHIYLHTDGMCIFSFSDIPLALTNWPGSMYTSDSLVSDGGGELQCPTNDRPLVVWLSREPPLASALSQTAEDTLRKLEIICSDDPGEYREALIRTTVTNSFCTCRGMI